MEIKQPSLEWSDLSKVYLTSKKFAELFVPKIPQDVFGTFLKVVGLSTPYQKVQPQIDFIPTYANCFLNEYKITYFVWNYQRCMEVFNDWLVSHGLSDRFSEIDSASEFKGLVNNYYPSSNMYIMDFTRDCINKLIK